MEWIKNKKKYNVRTGDARGSIKLTAKEAGAKYVLIYGDGMDHSNEFYKLRSEGPEINSKNDILKTGYPNPRNEYYLVFDFADETETEFKDLKWNVKKLLSKYGDDSKGFPFAVTLTQLMSEAVKDWYKK